MARSIRNPLARSARSTVDQAGAPDFQPDENTVWLGRQPNEPAPQPEQPSSTTSE